MVFYEELSLLMTKHRHRIEINTVNHCNSIILRTYTYWYRHLWNICVL